MANTTLRKTAAAGMDTQAAITTLPDNYTASLADIKRNIDEVKALIPAYLAAAVRIGGAVKAVING